MSYKDRLWREWRKAEATAKQARTMKWSKEAIEDAELAAGLAKERLAAEERRLLRPESKLLG